MKFLAITSCVVAFAAILVASLPHKEPRKVITNCNDLNRVSYCSSCFNVTNCNNGVETDTQGCDPNIEACIQSEGNSYCGPRENVAQCDCANGDGLLTGDAYDPQKGYECILGGPVIPVNCGRDEVFDEIQGCVQMFASTPFPPQPTFACESGETSFTQLDCTSYQECVSGFKEVIDCENGDIFSPVTNQCELYVPFTCTGRPDGLYPDSVLCNLARDCAGGVEVTQIPCTNGTVWDTVNGNCVTDPAACTLTGCFVPIPDYVECTLTNQTYPINSDSYYQCTSNAAGGFEPIPQSCEAGSYFDAATGSCLPYSVETLYKVIKERRGR